jgi:hypothetical protein
MLMLVLTMLINTFITDHWQLNGSKFESQQFEMRGDAVKGCGGRGADCEHSL